MFEFMSFNQFIGKLKSFFIPLKNNLNKYFLLFDNNATDCFELMLKFFDNDYTY